MAARPQRAAGVAARAAMRALPPPPSESSSTDVETASTPSSEVLSETEGSASVVSYSISSEPSTNNSLGSEASGSEVFGRGGSARRGGRRQDAASVKTWPWRAVAAHAHTALGVGHWQALSQKALTRKRRVSVNQALTAVRYRRPPIDILCVRREGPAPPCVAPSVGGPSSAMAHAMLPLANTERAVASAAVRCGEVVSCAFSPCGSLLCAAVGRPPAVLVHGAGGAEPNTLVLARSETPADFRSWRVLSAVPAPPGVPAWDPVRVCFVSGALLAAVLRDGAAVVVDLLRIAAVRVPGGSYTCASVSPEGVLVLGRTDGAVRLFSVALASVPVRPSDSANASPASTNGSAADSERPSGGRARGRGRSVSKISGRKAETNGSGGECVIVVRHLGLAPKLSGSRTDSVARTPVTSVAAEAGLSCVAVGAWDSPAVLQDWSRASPLPPTVPVHFSLATVPLVAASPVLPCVVAADAEQGFRCAIISPGAALRLESCLPGTDMACQATAVACSRVHSVVAVGGAHGGVRLVWPAVGPHGAYVGCEKEVFCLAGDALAAVDPVLVPGEREGGCVSGDCAVRALAWSPAVPGMLAVGTHSSLHILCVDTLCLAEDL